MTVLVIREAQYTLREALERVVKVQNLREFIFAINAFARRNETSQSSPPRLPHGTRDAHCYHPPSPRSFPAQSPRKRPLSRPTYQKPTSHPYSNQLRLFQSTPSPSGTPSIDAASIWNKIPRTTPNHSKFNPHYLNLSTLLLPSHPIPKPPLTIGYPACGLPPLCVQKRKLMLF